MDTSRISEKFEEILRHLNDSRESIKSATRFALGHKEHYTLLFSHIFEHMKKVFKIDTQLQT